MPTLVLKGGWMNAWMLAVAIYIAAKGLARDQDNIMLSYEMDSEV